MNFKTAQRLHGVNEYYFSKKLAEVRDMNARGLDVINLGIGSPDLAPSKAVIEATARALHDPHLHGYAPYRSLPQLRQAMARWYNSIYDVTLDPETEVLPLLGSKEGILYTMLAFVDPGDTVLVPDPGYPAYQSVASLIGARAQTYALTEAQHWYPDFAQLEKLDLSRVRLMWCNYPHMPTGQRAFPALFKQLIDFGRRHNILIVHDNPYGLVLNDEPPLSILKFDPERTVAIELNSMSKAFNMAGWRIGLVAGHEQVITAILKGKSNVDSGMFAPLQFGAVHALDQPPSWHQDRNAIYRQRRACVYQILDALKATYRRDQVGLFVWAKIADKPIDVAYADQILENARVLVVPGSVFGKNGHGYIRLSLCATEERLREALRRVQAQSALGIEKLK